MLDLFGITTLLTKYSKAKKKKLFLITLTSFLDFLSISLSFLKF